MSGCATDDFAHNSLIYKCVLDYYLRCRMSDVGGKRQMSAVRFSKKPPFTQNGPKPFWAGINETRRDYTHPFSLH